MKSAFFFGTWAVSLLVSGPLHAATQVEGVATYEVFRNGSEKPLLRVEENFSAIFQDDKWLVDTKLVSIQPSAPPQLFCPTYQKAGSDGGDSYFLKFMPKPNQTSQELLGWVEPGSEPNMAQSPSVTLIWLAYCSGSYLTKSGQNELRPCWGATSDENVIRQGKCIAPVSFRRNSENLEFLDQLSFHNDGRPDLCNPSRSYSNVYWPPWNSGFTQAVFQVTHTLTNQQGRSFPSDFTFELFAPGFRKDLPKLQMSCRLHGVVTNISNQLPPASWLPQLPENQVVGVRDYRFTETVTNWETVRYVVTNQFYQRTNLYVKAIVRINQESKPDSLPATSGR